MAGTAAPSRVASSRPARARVNRSVMSSLRWVETGSSGGRGSGEPAVHADVLPGGAQHHLAVVRLQAGGVAGGVFGLAARGSGEFADLGAQRGFVDGGDAAVL